MTRRSGLLGRGRSSWTGCVGLVAVLVMATGAAAAASECGGADCRAADRGHAPDAEVSLEASPVPAADEGDLVLDEDGLPTLTFMPSGKASQTAVHDYLVTNTGSTELRDVTLTTSHGEELSAGSLAPGESVTLRGRRTITYDQARSGLAGLVTHEAVVSAAAAHGTVDARTEVTIGVTAVLASPGLALVEEVVPGGDVSVGADGRPQLVWSEAEVAADTTKVVRYRVTATNVGEVALHDLEVTDVSGDGADVLVAGHSLAPGETVVTQVDRRFTLTEVLPGARAGEPVEAQVRTMSTARAVDGTGAVADAAAASVLDVRTEVRPPVDPGPAPTDRADMLPAAGPGEVLALLLAAGLLLAVGAGALRSARPVPRRG